MSSIRKLLRKESKTQGEFPFQHKQSFQNYKLKKVLTNESNPNASSNSNNPYKPIKNPDSPSNSFNQKKQINIDKEF